MGLPADYHKLFPSRGPIGRALGVPYGGLMRARRWAYRRGLLPSRAVDVPVICVGNLTCGGTGKTPMVARVVESLVAAGHQPAILTRGYKAVAGVSDEAEVLRELTGRPVIINPDRIAGARAAIADGADVLVMDDGFQHLRLRRDVNIVLIDATNPFGYGCCLPIGRLREPIGALAAADAIVLTHADQVSIQQWEWIRDFTAAVAPQAIRAAAEHKAVAVVDENGKDLPPEILADREAYIFCGIGNPESFLEGVITLGARMVAANALADHVEYTPQLIDEINTDANRYEAEVLLTTRKDAVKLHDAHFSRPLWTVRMEMELIEGEAELLALAEQACVKHANA